MPRAYAAALIAVDRSNRNLADPRPAHHELTQQVVRVPVARPKGFPCDCVEHAPVHGHEAALRVPVRRAQCETRRKREEVIAEPAKTGHRAMRRRPGETIALREVGPPFDQWMEQRREVRRIHLSIGPHDCRKLDAQGLGAATPSRDCRADPTIVRMLENGDRPSTRSSELRCRVGASVVHDDEVVHEVRNASEHRLDVPRFVVRRHDDGNAVTSEHF